MSPIIASLVIFPAMLRVDIRIRGTHKKSTKVVVPFSGVKPKLYEINAIGADQARSKTNKKTKFLLPIKVTNLAVM